MLTYHPTTEAEKEAICAWQYPGEYAMYNNPPYAEQKKHGYGFANPANNFYSFYDGETLVGFVNLSDEGSEVFFGIGAHPDHCGQGYGTQMTALAWDYPSGCIRASRCIWKCGRGTRAPFAATRRQDSGWWASR